jgi:hypothetical protein
LQTAIEKCPFETIYVMDSTLTESITTNWKYTVARIGSGLKIVFYGGGTLVGHHKFLESCDPLTDSVPSFVEWKNTRFQLDVNSTEPLFDLVPAMVPVTNSTCIPNALVFDGVELLRTTLADEPIPLNAIQCEGCRLENFTLARSSIIGEFKNGIHVNGTNVLELKVISTTIRTMSETGLSLTNPGGVYIDSNIIACRNNNGTSGVAQGCIHIFGSLMATNRWIRSNRIESNIGVGSPLFDGIYWDLDQALSFSQILLVAGDVRDNTVESSQYGIDIISDSIDSQYPCALDSDLTVNTIHDRNIAARGYVGLVVIQDALGIVQSYITSNANQIFCFIYDVTNATPQDLISLSTIYIIIGAAAVLLVFTFGQGMQCLCGIAGWFYGKNIDQMRINNNRRKMMDAQANKKKTN